MPSEKAACGIGHAEEANLRFRKQMEDESIFLDPIKGSSKAGLFAVFDGHGGREVSHEVAARFPTIFQDHLRSGRTPNPGVALRHTIKEIDDELKTRESWDFQGCTACICYISREKEQWIQPRDRGSTGKMGPTPHGAIHFANVGDSRAVLCSGGRTKRMTEDHKPYNADEVERIKRAGGFVVLGRVHGMLAVSRAIGDHGLKKFVISDPDVYTHVITDQDEFLIIACDGVWDVMSDEDAVECVRSSLRSEKSPQKAAHKLADKAIKARSQDNVSVLLVLLKEL
ncbi:Protein phosphatase 2C family like protein [Aduncisulcus paluster]|uniref:Protein phosphatase 2C family like protein n=1 Tax=Aduncisulcus paluster TaxID=2918883 RepID=A0ABQ5JXF1_9EUKA|nr:Protein phosphatase 2C family like protein [Aduncisulcus paluster]|eukprot:gnl/Carplike_NY0171/1548_a2101_1116.p1 GENE.gnl/Carplike_NY0171/1548_a2101_1116~~gnl/Carplike_NY0171/1548_a2101_1116.p1  ORF type:complete len:284 (-),score=64.98 gnl/Carplike_NY0171/1548_a2101_1116:73-924(-)